jgi:hypothetical protein
MDMIQYQKEMAEGARQFIPLNDIQVELVIYSGNEEEPVHPTEPAPAGTRFITLEHLLHPDTTVDAPSPDHYDFHTFQLALGEISQTPINVQTSMLVVEHAPGLPQPSPRFTRILDKSSFLNALYILSHQLLQGPKLYRFHLDTDGLNKRPTFFFPKWIRTVMIGKAASPPSIHDQDEPSNIDDASLDHISNPPSNHTNSSSPNHSPPGEQSNVSSPNHEPSSVLPIMQDDGMPSPEQTGEILDRDVLFDGEPITVEERRRWAKPIHEMGVSDEDYELQLRNWEEEIADINRSQ